MIAIDRGRPPFVHVLAALILALSLLGSAVANPAPARAVALTSVQGVVNAADGLSLRTGPGARYTLIRTLPKGTALRITATSADWFKVVAGTRTGWVNSWYVTLTGSGGASKAITRGNTSRKMIALTFDCGADSGSTVAIIETLERYGIHASFGLTGTWVAAYPELAAWIVADGNQVINHTLNHWSYTGYSDDSGPLSPAKRLAQLIAAETKIAGLTGGSAKPYWRPPFGDYDAGVLRDVGAAGYARTILWTVDSMGWNGYSANQIYQRVVDRVSNGAIVLMHVGSESADAATLERIIKTLLARGYSFGTVAQVIA